MTIIPNTAPTRRPIDVIVVSPGDLTTGGPEALHQLVDSINRQGGSAAVLYWAPGDDWQVPELYAHYNVPVATMDEVRSARYVVLAEIHTHLRSKFKGPSVGIWWLSVDNFFERLPRARTPLGWRLLRPPGLGMHRYLARRRPKWYVGGADFHLTQSHYASKFLEASGMNSTFIGDYMNEFPKDDHHTKLGTVVTNGGRGHELRQRFEEVNPHVPVTPLIGLSKAEVARAMSEATVYIDFGHQPGRDRMPRESAIRDCVIFTHRAGAGANDIDMAIPAHYRFESNDDELRRIGNLVSEVLQDPEPALAAQSSSRQQILGERDAFDAAVADFFKL